MKIKKKKQNKTSRHFQNWDKMKRERRNERREIIYSFPIYQSIDVVAKKKNEK